MYKQLISDKKFSKIIKQVAKKESLNESVLLNKINKGECVITLNKNKKIEKPCAIGKGTSTKVNVNIGTSPDKIDLKTEMKKLAVSVELGADTIMDLSLGGNLKKIRETIIDQSPIPVGTVPIYEAAIKVKNKKGSFFKMEKGDIFEVLYEQAESGVDFFTLHCGINNKSLSAFLKSKRVLDVVSRGGAILVNWMKNNKKENPLFEYFDEVLEIAKRYNITISLGDGMRPGSIMDASDEAQFSELYELGKLTQRARKAGVQVIIEGPGHVPIQQIQKNMELQKMLCHGAPFYVLGPLVTDVGLGYDHISCAIGGAIAATYGADFLCYLTPAEHVRHPSVEDTREGLVATKIAAHAADIAKGIKGATDWDKNISVARKKRDWKKQIALGIDPKKAKLYRESSHPSVKDVCTMCGEFCSIKLLDTCPPTV